MQISLPPRYSQLRAKPLVPGSFEMRVVPDSSLKITGEVRHLDPLGQGIVNQVYRLVGDETYILKVARGDYRQLELHRSHQLMSALQAVGQVPVAVPLKLVVAGDISYQLQTYLPEQNLREIAELPERLRLSLWQEIGQILGLTHQLPVEQPPWEQWLQGQLALAKANIKNDVIDPEEFVGLGRPEDVLVRLEEQLPEAPARLCLLHGDFRPKNIMGNDGGKSV